MTGVDVQPEVASPIAGTRRSRRRVARWVAVGVGVVCVAFAVVLASQVSNDPTYRGGKLMQQPAPAVSLTRLDGTDLTSREFAGKAVLINFWNTWCIPCQQELPALRDFAANHAGESDVLLVGIVRDDTEDAVRRYVKDKSILWPVAFDPDARAAIDFGTTGQPETYAIDRSGKVVAQQFGAVSVADLEAMLACAKGVCAR
ncbi:MAG: TlpA family protein disulfide reductase [Acidimicrobiia bacterium]